MFNRGPSVLGDVDELDRPCLGGAGLQRGIEHAQCRVDGESHRFTLLSPPLLLAMEDSQFALYDTQRAPSPARLLRDSSTTLQIATSHLRRGTSEEAEAPRHLLTRIGPAARLGSASVVLLDFLTCPFDHDIP
eukprot:scaffold111233_cov67-Phaeocystis_antarctica.AAC.2